MAFYIDFKFINIRDLVDLSEVDSEFENHLQSFVEEIFENNSENSVIEFKESGIKFLSEIVADSDTKTVTNSENKDVADIIMSQPIAETVVAPKPSVDKNQAYIKYINGKYEQSQADYFVNILLNPVKTNLANRFDYADVRNSYLTNQILGKDKKSVERSNDERRGQIEKSRSLENQRRDAAARKTELNTLFLLRNREQFKRV